MRRVTRMPAGEEDLRERLVELRGRLDRCVVCTRAGGKLTR